MKKNMKNKWLVAGAVAAFVALGATVQATPITGTINFQNGGVTLTGGTLAFPVTGTEPTGLTFSSGTVVASGFSAPTGNFAGTAGDAVTYLSSGFVFSPALSPNPVTGLWKFVVGATTFQFNLTSVTSSISGGSGLAALSLFGTGIVQETGYSDTFATWTFSTTGTGPASFNFIAGNKAPDGGTTVMLLGAGLSGLALLRKKLIA